MNPNPVLPPNAPFTANQRAWLNGYLAGLFYHLQPSVPAPVKVPDTALPLLILFGSQTGSAEQLSKRIALEAKKMGHQTRLLELNAVQPADLARETHLLIVTSTWGEGDPPDNAAEFWKRLIQPDHPRLDHLHFSVLALGDKNYADFCGAGKKFDARLAELGAQRFHARADCDTDYEHTAAAWIEGLWPAISRSQGLPSPLPASPAVPLRDDPPAPAATTYDRRRPFSARLLANRKLNAAGSEKDTRHLEICLRGSGLSYKAGDALGVVPTNCPELVSELLQALRCEADLPCRNAQDQETTLADALSRSYEITRVPQALLKAFAERSKDKILQDLLRPDTKIELDRFLHGREIIDLFFAHPEVKFDPQEFLALLRPLQPRLYSISSSPKAHPDQVHLTVATVRYQTHGRMRKGVCSTFFADRVKNETPVPIFIQPSSHFCLPSQPDTPVIMVGPGTGIAPFRAFLQERRATGSPGKNWLFFGDQHAGTDFLYRDEIEQWLRERALTRLDTAFSRDQEKKIYVQDRMLDQAKLFWEWLETGACVYVCGDAKRMAKDVESALLKIVETEGNLGTDGALAYLQDLKASKRYQRDVY